MEVFRQIDFFDTHVHLSEPRFDGDREAVIERAAAAGVARLIEIADAPADWPKALALTRARPKTFRAAVGLHPYYAERLTSALLLDFERHCLIPEVAAIGEIGLDYAKSSIDAETQKRTFERLLALGRDKAKPCVIHCREAYPDLLGIISRIYPAPPESGCPGVVHCFTGSESDADFLRRRGFFLGVDAPVTYPKNESLRRILRSIGPGGLVLETDSPYLPPQSRRGARNEPAHIPEIASKLSEILCLPLAAVAQATTQNAEKLFGLEPVVRRA